MPERWSSMPGEARQDAIALVREKDPELARLLAQELEIDPNVQLIVRQMEGLREDFRSAQEGIQRQVVQAHRNISDEVRNTRHTYVALASLSLVLMATLVGTGMYYADSERTVHFTPRSDPPPALPTERSPLLPAPEPEPTP